MEEKLHIGNPEQSKKETETRKNIVHLVCTYIKRCDAVTLDRKVSTRLFAIYIYIYITCTLHTCNVYYSIHWLIYCNVYYYWLTVCRRNIWARRRPVDRQVKTHTRSFSGWPLEPLIIFYSSHLIFSPLILNKNVNKLPIRQHKSITEHNLPNYSMSKR